MKLRFIFCMALLGALSAAAEVKIEEWKPAFRGVEQTQGSIDGADASVFYAVRVDLRAKGIKLVGKSHEGSFDTISETTSSFLKETHSQIAVNGGFFAPCCKAVAEPKHILGLSMTEGKVVSHGMRAAEYKYVFVVDRKNHARIEELRGETPAGKPWLVLTGSAIIATEGKNTGDATKLNSADKPNPRTIIGLSQNRRYLYLVVVDGRKPGYSIGTTNKESAEILLKLGAYTGVNLDGGGSTDMVKDDGNGGFVIINKPSGGAERFDANQLGVQAQPLNKK